MNEHCNSIAEAKVKAKNIIEADDKNPRACPDDSGREAYEKKRAVVEKQIKDFTHDFPLFFVNGKMDHETALVVIPALFQAANNMHSSPQYVMNLIYGEGKIDCYSPEILEILAFPNSCPSDVSPFTLDLGSGGNIAFKVMEIDGVKSGVFNWTKNSTSIELIISVDKMWAIGIGGGLALASGLLKNINEYGPKEVASMDKWYIFEKKK